MLGAVDEMQEVGDEPAVVYHVGETVKVNYGPFNGFSVIIEEVNNIRLTSEGRKGSG